MARLFAARGEFVSRDELIDCLYGWCADGGPVQADNCNRVQIFRLRRLLKALGIRIVTQWGRGYRVEVV